MNIQNLDKPAPIRVFLDSRNAIYYDNGRSDQPVFAFPTPIRCPCFKDCECPKSDMLSVCYSEIIPINTQAIKELSDLVTSLTNRISELEQKLSS